MFIIHFGFRKPEIAQGYLYGERSHLKIFIVRLGFMSIIKMGSDATQVVHRAIQGLLGDSDWLLTNHPEVTRQIKKGVAEANDERLEREIQSHKLCREELSRTHQQLMQRNNDVSVLKGTLKILEE